MVLSLCRYVSLSLSLCRYVSPSLCRYVSPSLCRYVSPSLCRYVSPSLCRYVSPSLCRYISLNTDSNCILVLSSILLSPSPVPNNTKLAFAISSKKLTSLKNSGQNKNLILLLVTFELIPLDVPGVTVDFKITTLFLVTYSFNWSITVITIDVSQSPCLSSLLPLSLLGVGTHIK